MLRDNEGTSASIVRIDVSRRMAHAKVRRCLHSRCSSRGNRDVQTSFSSHATSCVLASFDLSNRLPWKRLYELHFPSLHLCLADRGSFHLLQKSRLLPHSVTSSFTSFLFRSSSIFHVSGKLFFVDASSPSERQVLSVHCIREPTLNTEF